jgi:hypothetical protein
MRALSASESVFSESNEHLLNAFGSFRVSFADERFRSSIIGIVGMDFGRSRFGTVSETIAVSKFEKAFEAFAKERVRAVVPFVFGRKTGAIDFVDFVLDFVLGVVNAYADAARHARCFTS